MGVEAFFAGHPLGLESYHRMLALLAPLGDPEVRVTKSQVAFRRRRAFAWLWLPGTWLTSPATDVVLSISLRRRDDSPRWKEVVQLAAGAWMHHLEVGEVAELDAEVARWLAEAWVAAA